MTQSPNELALIAVEHLVRPRHPNGEQLALVRAEVPSTRAELRDFLAALDRALRQWFTTSDDGQDAWRQSGGDFTIGDLAGELMPGDPALRQCLEAEGLYHLRIDTYSLDPEQPWDFATVLGHPEAE